MLLHASCNPREGDFKTYAIICATLLFLLALYSPVMAEEIYFSTDPVWLSDPVNNTTTSVFGDVDLDGDLDLVCCNLKQLSSQYIALYLNNDGKLSSAPNWFLVSSDDFQCIALGDINGDGYIDIVSGNYNQSNRLFLNVGGVFSDTPIWSSEPSNITVGVALGDVDDDGDLDLICGNYEQKNTLYLNEGGIFSTTPVWSSGPANKTLVVALGDVNGDGDLDLVCGNGDIWEGQSNTLYLNQGGAFSTEPDWSSDQANRTRCMALGDIDGDGDFDLACGNMGDVFGGECNTLYQNDGNKFSTSPMWASRDSNSTMEIALGDVDKDGDLDLVCGNTSSTSNTLYINHGGTIDSVPAWSSDAELNTQSLDLGDFDGDGDLDLICGNAEVNALYLNETHIFSASPAWSSGPANRTSSAALGDVDGDGDLDLVCGNGCVMAPGFQSNTLYLNAGDAFSITPDWSSDPANQTYDVALGDIDGDWDLDLVCGNYDFNNTLYLNVGGTFSGSPAWSSGPTRRTSAVALGDVDGDGDLDLVCGNYLYGNNSLYLNEGGHLSRFAKLVSRACR